MKPSEEYIDSLVAARLQAVVDKALSDIAKEYSTEDYERICHAVRLVLYDRKRLLVADE